MSTNWKTNDLLINKFGVSVAANEYLQKSNKLQNKDNTPTTKSSSNSLGSDYGVIKNKDTKFWTFKGKFCFI